MFTGILKRSIYFLDVKIIPLFGKIVNITTFLFLGYRTRERAARTGRNPQTGEEIKIEAATTPAFKAGKALKDKVNK